VFATDTANILAAVNKLPTSGSTPGGVVILRAGQYSASLPDVANVTYRGQGRTATEIRCTSGVMLATTGVRQGISFESLTLSTAGGHLIELGTGATGLANGHYFDVQMVSYSATSSILHGTGGVEFLGYTLRDVLITRATASTVPAIDLTSSGGNLNANVFDTVTIYGANSTGAPAIRLESTAGAFCHDNTFRNIVGEQNRGGLLHVYSPSGLSVENATDWDATGNYTDHLVRIDKSATAGAQPRNIHARNVGTRFGTLAAGIAHFYMPTTLSPAGVLLENVGDPNGTSVIIAPSTGRTIVGKGAAQATRAVTASYTIDPLTDRIILTNGSTVNVTLPNPTLIPVGTAFRVTNLNAAVCGVISAGGANVNGSSSATQAQWVSKEWVTDGSQWLG
jgi:hypothetical protein